MKTITEVAKLLNVSQQAIYKKVNKQLHNELKPFIQDIKRGSKLVKVINDEGVELIRASLEFNAQQPIETQLITNNSELLIISLRENIEDLRKQLEIKDIQIAVANELTKNQQILALRLKERQPLLENRKWWKWTRGN